MSFFIGILNGLATIFLLFRVIAAIDRGDATAMSTVHAVLLGALSVFLLLRAVGR